MLIETWADVLTRSFQELWLGVIAFIPNIIVALIIFVLGWLVGAALGRIVSQIIKALKVDSALKSTGLNDVVSRAGFELNSGAFLGALIKWFFIVVFLVAALDVLQLSQVNEFLQNVVLGYLPQVIVAVLILLVAAVIADLAAKAVSGAAKAAHVRSAGLAGSVAKWSIWIFAILAALDHLQVASAFVQTLFTGVIVAVSLAFGLAFGLGGQQAAAKYIEKLRSEVGHEE
ncbi:MAG: mechanosensitive ion channel family protein [Patescibacteria group bacterium UBA2163]